MPENPIMRRKYATKKSKMPAKKGMHKMKNGEMMSGKEMKGMMKKKK